MVTLFNNGYYFDEVVGYKKDLFKALRIDLPTVSFNKDDLIDNDNTKDYCIQTTKKFFNNDKS